MHKTPLALQPCFVIWLVVGLVIAPVALAPSAAQAPAVLEEAAVASGSVPAVFAPHGMVVAQESARRAHRRRDPRAGGNAVDAAVAIGFALAVTYPRAGNIGGGGFMVIHLATRQRDIAIDYRETAPAAIDARHRSSTRRATPTRRSRATPRSAIGVPGTVAGLALAHEKYGSGKFTLAELIAPAIALAREGIRGRRRSRRFAAARAAAARALAGLGEDFLQAPTARRSAAATGWCSAISPTRSRRSPQTGRAPSTKAPIADKLIARRCAPPAAS